MTDKKVYTFDNIFNKEGSGTVLSKPHNDKNSNAKTANELDSTIINNIFNIHFKSILPENSGMAYQNSDSSEDNKYLGNKRAMDPRLVNINHNQNYPESQMTYNSSNVLYNPLTTNQNPSNIYGESPNSNTQSNVNYYNNFQYLHNTININPVYSTNVYGGNSKFQGGAQPYGFQCKPLNYLDYNTIQKNPDQPHTHFLRNLNSNNFSVTPHTERFNEELTSKNAELIQDKKKEKETKPVNYGVLSTLLGKSANKVGAVSQESNLEVHFENSNLDEVKIYKIPIDNQYSYFTQKFVPKEAGGSYKSYIDKAYTQCIKEEDLVRTEYLLNQMLKKPEARQPSFYKKNWINFPLPNINKVEPAQIKEYLAKDIIKSIPSDAQKKKNSIKVAQETIIEEILENSEKRKQRFIDEEKRHQEKLQAEKLKHSSNDYISNICIEAKNLSKFSNIDNSTKETKFVGTNMNLEKSYLRTTSLLTPEQVRPYPILEKAFKLMIKKWKERDKPEEYNYISDQLRSIRQDLTVQCIKNEFTIKVYETNAKISLEAQDLDQFNQCQSLLIPLYKSGIKGNEIEFLALRILYDSMIQPKYSIENLLKEIYNGKSGSKPEIVHALKILKAINEKNYFSFFKYFKESSKFQKLLMQPFISRLQIKALQSLALGYYSEIKIEKIYQQLGFESQAEFIFFLESNSKS